MMRERLTQKFCESVAVADRNVLYRCSETRNFALQVTPNGNRSFVFAYVSPVTSRERRMAIGNLREWTIAAARKRAEELRRAVDRGIDPLGQKEAVRSALSLKDLWVWYSAGPLLKKSVGWQTNVHTLWRKHIFPILGQHLKADQLTRAAVQQMHDRISDLGAPTAANRALATLKHVLRLAHENEMISDKRAAVCIKRNVETARERYLDEVETARLLEAIDRLPKRDQPSGFAVMLLLLTGARRSEVLGMRWAEVDLERALWTKPASRTKARRQHEVHLSSAACVILRGALILAEGNEFVFPSSSKEGHLRQIKRTWASIIAAAELPGVRLHDLRHTFASMMISDGRSLAEVKAQLGHTQIQTTDRYSHLMEDRRRQGAEGVASRVLAARSIGTAKPARVISDSALPGPVRRKAVRR